MNMKKISKVMILLVMLTTGLVSCKQESKTRTEIIQPVKTFKVSGGSNQLSEKVFTGLVKESREVKLAFQIAGPLVKLNVNEGQFVKKGQVIAALNERDYLVQLEAANAQFDNAKLQAERYTALYEKKSTSKSVYDQVQAAFKLAKAQKEAAENALNDTKIYAPFSGYVQAMYVENYEKVGAGQPIVSLLDLNNLELTVALSENDFLQSKLYETFNCKFENFKDVNFDLSLIDIEKKPNGDSFFRMRLKIDKKDYQIVPGMTASVSVGLRSIKDSSFKLPVASVFSKKGKSYVWIFNSSKNCVEQREVELMSFDSQGMINIAKGVSKGEVIVAAGVHSLQEGQKVKMLDKRSKTNIGGQL
ncbi:efflux RND transporter periplasmic adaptor subunit [Marinifilum sp. RC60d5]|uniref:efflux RND transporter periplasmic adaptor subunit n=1 Tax=Marinifilum sp. RC60d5 TaxID=3458414 RepID=UPI0040355B66